MAAFRRARGKMPHLPFCMLYSYRISRISAGAPCLAGGSVRGAGGNPVTAWQRQDASEHAARVA